MSRLFALLGVDYTQWKAVSRTLLRSDFRAPTPQTSETYSLRSIGGPLSMALVYGVFGVGPVVLIVLNSDVLLTGTITLGYFTFALATALLTQHGASMLSPADYVILGSRPVTSRTFFAIRLTNVLFHAGLTTTFMAYPPVIAFTLAHGVNIGRGLGAVVAIYAWAAGVTLVVVAGYAALLRVVGGARLQRAVAYLQLVIGIAAYGGFFLAMEGFGRSAIRGASLPESGWLFAMPPVWFTGFIEIGAGEANALSWLRAALSILMLVALGALLHGSLAPSYVDKLGEQPLDAPSRPSRPVRRPLLFAKNEARAVALLTLAHFRHDLRVRMGVFGVVPLLLLYTLLGMRSGANPDPFLEATRGRPVDLLAMAALMFPVIITRHLESSGSYQAAWIYSVTIANAGRLIIALKNVTVVCFLVPFGAALALLYLWRFGDPGHALAHTAVLLGISHVMMQVGMLVHPRLPFAHPPDKSGGTAVIVWMVVVLLGGQLLIAGIQRFVYPSWSRVAACVVALAAIAAVLEATIRRRTKN